MSAPGYHPGPLVIGSCVQVRLKWTLANSKTVYNVLHGSVGGGFVATAAIAENIFTAVKAAAGWTNWKPKVNSACSLAGVDMRDLRSANQPLVSSTSGASAGTGAGTALPPGDALAITFRTASAGRAFRGRTYLPGLDHGALTAAGLLAGGNDALAVAFVTAVQTAMAGQGLTLCLAQATRDAYTSAKTQRHFDARPANVVTVSSIECRNTILDHQRRRAGRS